MNRNVNSSRDGVVCNVRQLSNAVSRSANQALTEDPCRAHLTYQTPPPLSNPAHCLTPVEIGQNKRKKQTQVLDLQKGKDKA